MLHREAKDEVDPPPFGRILNRKERIFDPQLTPISKHIKLKHRHDYPCSVNGCGAAFSENTTLKRHINSVHNKGGGGGVTCPNSWCKIPDKVFDRKDNLKRHMKRCGVDAGSEMN